MTIFGKPLSDYIDFCRVFLVLIPLVGIIGSLILAVTRRVSRISGHVGRSLS